MNGPTAAPAHFPYRDHGTMAEVMLAEFLEHIVDNQPVIVAAQLAGFTPEQGEAIMAQVAAGLGEAA